MPTFRVNIRQVEVSLIVKQVEVVADDPEHAAIFASMGINKQITIPDGEEVVRTKVRRLNPDTYTVMDAAPIQEMEKAQRKKWARQKIQPWYGDSKDTDLGEE